VGKAEYCGGERESQGGDAVEPVTEYFHSDPTNPAEESHSVFSLDLPTVGAMVASCHSERVQEGRRFQGIRWML